MNRLPKFVAGLALGSFSFVLTGCGGGEPTETQEGAAQQQGASQGGTQAPEGGGGTAAAPAKTADAAVQQVLAGLAKDDPSAFWSAMPASYQQQLNDTIHEAAGKVRPDVYNAAMATVTKLVEMLDEKGEFLVESQMVQGMAAQNSVDPSAMAAGVEGLVAVLGTLANSEIGTHDGLAAVDLGKMLAGTGSQLMAQLHTASKAVPDQEWPDFAAAKVEQVSAEGDAVKLKITVPGMEAVEDEFMQVDGRWLPKKMVEGWDQEMAELKVSIAEMAPTDEASAAQVKAMLGGIGMQIDTLAQTDTKEDFEAALGQMMQPLMMMMMGGGPAGGPPGGPAGGPPGSGFDK
jgi:hypothetical protein